MPLLTQSGHCPASPRKYSELISDGRTMADHKRETFQVSRESVSFTDMKTGINI